MDIREALETYKIITIIRGVPAEKLLPVAEALYAGGIRLMEVTFDQTGKIPAEETAGMIRTLCREFGGRMRVGAGTVLTKREVELAVGAGAEYMISPDVSEEVIRRTKELGCVSIPGALTPTEITTAYRFGADYVKLFPAGDLGTKYVKSVRAPLAHIPMMAVGGITAENLGEFLATGVVGVGISSSIVNKELIGKGDYAGLTELAKRYTSQI